MGDSSWVQEALREYESPLIRYARSLLGDLEEARDVVQDTFLRLCRQEPDRVRGHLAQWLFTVCRNRALDIRRKEGRMKSLEQAPLAALKSSVPQPQRVVEARQELDRVDEILATLTPNQQEVIRLKFQQGLSYKEISAVTELSVSNVGFLIHTGLKKVRRELGLGTPEATHIRRIK